AAIDGLGVALTQNALAGDDLAAGRLGRLFEATLPTHFAYYVVAPSLTAIAAENVSFREWLVGEANIEDARLSGEAALRRRVRAAPSGVRARGRAGSSWPPSSPGPDRRARRRSPQCRGNTARRYPASA